MGGINTAAVSDLQPAITVSAVTVTQPASSGLITTPPPSSTSSGSGSAPAATTSDAGSGGGGLAVGAEIGSIVVAICGAIALGVSIFFGRRGLEKRNESTEKKLAAKEEEEEAEKAAQEQPMISSPRH